MRILERRGMIVQIDATAATSILLYPDKDVPVVVFHVRLTMGLLQETFLRYFSITLCIDPIVSRHDAVAWIVFILFLITRFRYFFNDKSQIHKGHGWQISHYDKSGDDGETGDGEIIVCILHSMPRLHVICRLLGYVKKIPRMCVFAYTALLRGHDGHHSQRGTVSLARGVTRSERRSTCSAPRRAGCLTNAVHQYSCWCWTHAHMPASREHLTDAHIAPHCVAHCMRCSVVTTCASV